ncbi:MAG: Gfo/Idh/MocA family oxidoreductase [Chthonomonadetes bacterium]|nr:Gfo/Idh/MocA family oxidoreductase [Chthonomonadetes bacterium]
MSNQTLRVGLIGAGGIGRTHLASYERVREAQIVAIADINEDLARAAAQQVGAQAFQHVEQMLEQVELDAVDICTPPSAHLEAALLAIERGLNVLCEKPLAHHPDAAREMVRAAEEKGVKLMTAFCHRFHPPVVALKRLIEAGELGEVVMFRNRFAGPFKGVEERWFSDKEIAGGGVLMDTSVHSIDLFRFLVGEVARVQAVVRQTNPAIGEVEDTAIALLATEDNRMGVVEASWSLAAGFNVVEVYGTEGVGMVHYWDGFKSRYKTLKMDDWQPLEEVGPDRFVGEIQHFVDACLGRAPLQVTGYDGLRAVEIVYEAYRVAQV